MCLSGGVALNCVTNGKLLRENIYDNIWIQPASGDARVSLGAAMYHLMEKKRVSLNEIKDLMNGAYLGPSFTQKRD